MQLLVPVHTYPEGNDPAIAAHVASLARHLKAEVDVLVLKPVFPPVSSPLGGFLMDVPTLVQGTLDRCAEKGDAILREMTAVLQKDGIDIRTFSAESVFGAYGDVAVAEGRYRDLTVIGLGRAGSAARASAENAIFKTGRPTLLVPESAPRSAWRHAMIAWDGSAVAARAVADAMEFLRRAGKVTVVTVTGEKDLPADNPGDRLVAYLSRRGIAAVASSVDGARGRIGEVLQGHAQAIGADFLVMGAFGHTRFREFILGGATDAMLRDPKVPVLMSH